MTELLQNQERDVKNIVALKIYIEHHSFHNFNL